MSRDVIPWMEMHFPPHCSAMAAINRMMDTATKLDTMMVATVNGVYVQFAPGDNPNEIYRKYERDFDRLPQRKKVFSIVSHTASAWMAVGFFLIVKGLMA